MQTQESAAICNIFSSCFIHLFFLSFLSSVFSLSYPPPLHSPIRHLEVRYPHFPSEQEFTHCILSAGDLQQHSEGGNLRLLTRFAMDWPRLQIGAVLLPDLVELYQWLHTSIAFLITNEYASTVTIGQVIQQAKKNISKQDGQYLWKLYKRVEHNYNAYVELIGRSIGSGACAAVRQGNKIFTIADNIPVLHFLSGTCDFLETDCYISCHFGFN